MKIKACPICGRPALHNCYHNGGDRTTVWMDSSEALRLLEATERAARAELKGVVKSIAKIIQQENCNHIFHPVMKDCILCRYEPPK